MRACVCVCVCVCVCEWGGGGGGGAITYQPSRQFSFMKFGSVLKISAEIIISKK